MKKGYKRKSQKAKNKSLNETFDNTKNDKSKSKSIQT